MSESEPSDWEDKFHEKCYKSSGENISLLDPKEQVELLVRKEADYHDCKKKKFNNKCSRELSRIYHPDKQKGRAKGRAADIQTALNACKDNTELRRPDVLASPTTTAGLLATTAFGAFVLLGAAPFALPAAGITAALSYGAGTHVLEYNPYVS